MFDNPCCWDYDISLLPLSNHLYSKSLLPHPVPSHPLLTKTIPFLSFLPSLLHQNKFASSRNLFIYLFLSFFGYEIHQGAFLRGVLLALGGEKKRGGVLGTSIIIIIKFFSPTLSSIKKKNQNKTKQKNKIPNLSFPEKFS